MDIDKYNYSDNKYNEDTINEILQELIMEEERKVGDTKEGTIQFNMEWVNLVVSKNHFLFSK